MIELDYSFDKSPWEAFLEAHKQGDSVSAARLLAFLEEENDDAAEDAFSCLNDRGLILDLSQLPKPSGTGPLAMRLRQEEQLAREGLNLRELGENDPLRLYLEEIARNRETADEEKTAAAYLAGEEAAMQTLINVGLRRVVEKAKEYVGRGVLLLDLIQEGSLGLWQGICGFHGGEYGPWRDRWICNAMAKAVTLQARSSGIFQKIREATEDYRAVDERLLSELGRNPTLEEIAGELHMSLEETESVRKVLEDARLIQRAVKEEEPEESKPEDQQAVEDTAYFQMRQRILELLSTLSEEDARLLSLRFGLDQGKPLSPEETGARMGLTTREVISREAKALAMLRSQE